MDKKLESTYSTVEYLDNLYYKTDFEYAFKANNLKEWKVWRDGFKDKLIKLLGINLFSRRCELEPIILEK